MPFCTKCGKEISQQDYEKFDGLCPECYLPVSDKTIQNTEETTKKPQTFINKYKIGIASLICDLIGGILILIFSGSLYILSATPFTLIGTILGGVAIRMGLDQSIIFAVFGLFIGLILFFISAFPLIEFLAAFTAIGGGGV